MKFEKSKLLFKKASHALVGGVNSPVRNFSSVGGTPLFIKKGQGSKIVDEDGNIFIDFVNSWGPLILGHAHPRVIKAIEQQARRGTTFGAPTAIETEFICEIQKAFPSMEKIRLVSSGTESTQSAIRLARGYTQRDLIVKFEGCYHGHTDPLLVKAGSGGATFGVATSKGIPEAASQYTFVLPYNDTGALERLFSARGKQIACVIVEPVAANMGVVLPKRDFLQKMRELCSLSGALLIFDEVITGFRIAKGGAQEYYGITADLTCLGKIIGGGLPMGAYGGKEALMKHVCPEGNVYQAGTLSGNPLAVVAGLSTVKTLSQVNSYKKLLQMTEYVCKKIEALLQFKKEKAQINWICGMFTVFFSDSPVVDFKTAQAQDSKTYAAYFHFMLERGIYLPPSPYEACMISLAHEPKELDLYFKAFSAFLSSR
ncbi:MAG: glutamate-1-semialdehyde 2,1-aminomutase [Deltaproteobacteria bacterium]|nr:glutamate-1-semialdehyde 2,1-aminomutase [Deltaproteobacteria bacterium]